MKIAIINNWNNTKTFFIYKLLKEFYNGNVEYTTDAINCDILIHSVFGNDNSYKNTKAKNIIFTTHETRFYINIAKERIPYSNIVLSYLPTDNEKFFRIPLWYYWIDWWNERFLDEVQTICVQSHHYIGGNILLENYVPTLNNIKTNIYNAEDIWNRKELFVMLVGNIEPDCIKERQNIFNEITKLYPVSGYGIAFGKRFEGNKIDLITKFKSNICYENSIHSGYCTEKLFDAIFAGCLPLYNGDPVYSKIDFNSKRFINQQDYSNIQDYIKDIQKIIIDKNKFCDIVSEPMFNENQYPSLNNIYEFLKNKLV